MVAIFNGKGDIRNCSCYRAVKLLEHEMKVVERVLKRLCRIVTVDEMQFGCMLARGTIDAVFILRRLQEEYHAKGKKMYMCFVKIEEAFDRVPKKVSESAMRKKGIPEVLIRSVMSLNEGARTRVRVDSELSEEGEAKVGMHLGSVLSTFLFAVFLDVTEFAREGALCELLYSDDLFLLSKTIERPRNKFLKWKEDFEINILKVDLGKPR